MKTKIPKEDLKIFDRAVSHWKEENKFAFWKNLSRFQRKVLTKDIMKLREALQECIDMIHTLEYYNDELDQKVEELLKQ